MKNLSLRTLGVAAIAVLLTLVLAYSVSISSYFEIKLAEAQAISLPASLEGFAWSSNIGWISFSCENTGTCATVDYGVDIDTSGNVTGYAWSDNIGWIQFGGLSSFPSALGNTAANAQFNPVASNYEFAGWARACAGTVHVADPYLSDPLNNPLPDPALPGDCSTMTSRPDGWDGWISLKGNLHTATFAAGVANTDAYAWGGPVVGWIAFNAGFDPVTMVETPNINTFTATPDEVPLGSNTTLEWTVQGMTSCTASNNRSQGDWSGSVTSAGTDSAPVTPPEGTTDYILSCDGTDGNTYTEQISVLALQDIDVTALSCTNCDSLPAPQADGSYDGVTFLVNVAGLEGSNTAPFEFTFAGQTVTGNIGSGNTTVTVNNVTFGTHNARIEVDLPAPGSINEDLPSTGVDEDVAGNSRDLNNVFITPAPPNMTLTPDSDLVRYNQTVDVDVDITSTYDASCEFVGPGISSGTISISAGVPYSNTFTSDPLQSTSAFLLTCTEPTTNTSFSEEVRVEVVPNTEEI